MGFEEDIKRSLRYYKRQERKKLEWIASQLDGMNLDERIIALRRPLYGKRKLSEHRVDALKWTGEKVYSHAEFEGQFDGLGEYPTFTDIRNRIRNRQHKIIVFKDDYSRKREGITVMPYETGIRRVSICRDFPYGSRMVIGGEIKLWQGNRTIYVKYSPLLKELSRKD